MAQMSEEQIQAWWRDFSFLTEDEQRALVQAERDKQEEDDDDQTPTA